MTYDCAGPWTDSAQLDNSAIFPTRTNPRTVQLRTWRQREEEAIDIYVQDLQVPKAKLNIGTPFYGYFYHKADALWRCPNQDCSDSVRLS